MNPTLLKATSTCMFAIGWLCSSFALQNSLISKSDATCREHTNGKAASASVRAIDQAINFKLAPPPPLPLTLIQFTAVKTNSGKVELTWKTAQEINVSHFNVERSSDGRKWTKVGTKPAKGQQGAVTTYTFTDPSPIDNANYYRLHVVDYDHKSDYSPVRLVSFTKETAVRIYPTLATANTTIYVEGISPEVTMVEIFNNSGRPVQKMRLYSNTFNASGLTAGIYHVRITDISNVSTACLQKIVIY